MTSVPDAVGGDHMRAKTALLTISLALLPGLLQAQERPKVAIKTFANPSNYSKSNIGNGLTDILTTELENTSKFNVLERSNVDELTKEMDFGNSEYAKASSFAQKGNLLGAQYLLMGKVTNFSYTEHAERRQKVNLLGPNTIETLYQQQADVRVDFRLIDVSSGETVISQAGEAHDSNTSKTSELATWYRCTTTGSITTEASSSLIGKATTEAVKNVVQKLNSLSNTVRERGAAAALTSSFDNLSKAKGQLVAEEGGGLWIVGGVGSANGLKKGDHLKIVHENLVKDAAGKVVYRKPVDIGTLEVTDVAQEDHAEARLVSSTAKPQLNDLVAVDMDFAHSLRGDSSGAATATAAATSTAASSSASSAGAGAGADSPQLQQTLKRADSYLNDKFWSQALDEYKRAAELKPSDPRVLQGEAVSQYMMGDFIEADESADKLLHQGGALTIAVAHYHPMGTCTGRLTIQSGKLTFESDKNDGFDVTPANLGGVAVQKISKPIMANEKAPDWPVLEVKWRDGGHEKKYQLIPYMYSKQQNLSGKNFATAFPMDDSDVRQMQKMEQSLLALIQKYVH